MADRQFDVVIIGGGASGLAAAIELGMKSSGLSVALLEKNPEPARKIRATGSGRCNITNTGADGYGEITDFFRRIGLVTRAYENGLVYPYSESAADVAELLISRAEELGTEIINCAEVNALHRSESDQSFTIEYFIKGTEGTNKGKPRTARIRAYNLILATGGKAGPSYGTTGDGYRLARELGHSIVTPVPVLTSIECKEWNESAKPCAISLAGTRTKGRVTLVRDSEIFSEEGEIQFTKYGLSGICVFNMTRFMRYNRAAGESLADFHVLIDLFTEGDLEEELLARRDNAFRGERTGDILRTILKENIADYVIQTAARACGSKNLKDKLLGNTSDEEIRSIAKTVHSCRFTPEGIRGWKEAQATSGGVSLEEIDSHTCESRIEEGLYITGELADNDFPCGGFNLSYAWLTGMHAADSIAEKLSK